jgi:hypothetical protein
MTYVLGFRYFGGTLVRVTFDSLRKASVEAGGHIHVGATDVWIEKGGETLFDYRKP